MRRVAAGMARADDNRVVLAGVLEVIVCDVHVSPPVVLTGGKVELESPLIGGVECQLRFFVALSGVPSRDAGIITTYVCGAACIAIDENLVYLAVKRVHGAGTAVAFSANNVIA